MKVLIIILSILFSIVPVSAEDAPFDDTYSIVEVIRESYPSFNEQDHYYVVYQYVNENGQIRNDVIIFDKMYSNYWLDTQAGNNMWAYTSPYLSFSSNGSLSALVVFRTARYAFDSTLDNFDYTELFFDSDWNLTSYSNPVVPFSASVNAQEVALYPGTNSILYTNVPRLFGLASSTSVGTLNFSQESSDSWGMFQWLKDGLDFLFNTLLGGIINFFTGLIFPDGDYWNQFFTDIQTFLSQKLGFLFAPFDIILSLANTLLSGTARSTITVPAIFGGALVIRFDTLETIGAWAYIQPIFQALVGFRLVTMIYYKWQRRLIR